MKGFLRAIRYFTLLAGEYIALCLVVAAACFLFGLLWSERVNTEGFPVVVLLVLYLFIVVFSMGNNLIMPSLVIPYSCTRKSLFWGTQYMMLLIVSAILVLLGIYCHFFTEAGLRGFLRLLPASAGLFAASVGLGALLGGIVLKFGRAAVVIMTACSGILGGVVGFCFSAFSDDRGIDPVLMTFLSKNAVWILPAGFAVLLLGDTVNYSILRKTAVTR